MGKVRGDELGKGGKDRQQNRTLALCYKESRSGGPLIVGQLREIVAVDRVRSGPRSLTRVLHSVIMSSPLDDATNSPFV